MSDADDDGPCDCGCPPSSHVDSADGKHRGRCSTCKGSYVCDEYQRTQCWDCGAFIEGGHGHCVVGDDEGSDT